VSPLPVPGRPPLPRAGALRGARARLLGFAALSASGLALSAFASASCTGTPINASVRALERSGTVAFVCLGAPGEGSARALDDCDDSLFDRVDDFGDDGQTPHLYALVTQETRGEVALVDLSTGSDSLLDQDPSTPGDSFLPVGARPVSILATPGGTAAFVAAAELVRPALYALPTATLRPCEVDGSRCDEPAPTLSSWPACELPAAPGAMVLAYDPVTSAGVRPSCDADYEPIAPGTIDAEGRGRAKLVVSLPTRGELVVIDAQALLDQPPGSFGACPIERSLELSAEVPLPSPPDSPEPAPGCAVPDTVDPGVLGPFAPVPSGMAIDEGTLYVGDLGAPLVHVVDVARPCEATELVPFVVTSSADPSRVVKTTEVAVSRRAPGGARYLYAIDVDDRSVVVFDASDAASSREPLPTGSPANPITSDDRIRFASAPRGLLMMQRDLPKAAPGSGGVAPFGTECNPDPAASVCSSSSETCDPGTLYRTAADYGDGAGPLTLRGSFALVALASGQISVLDVEDYDAACRGPRVPSADYGCDVEGGPEQFRSGEPSCGVVVPHAPRSAFYVLTNDDVGRHQPGVQSFPILSLPDGSVLSESDPSAPRLRVTRSAEPLSSTRELVVGGDKRPIDPATGAASDTSGERNTVLFDLADPRVHQFDQEWFITYEGRLPGFAGRSAELRLEEGGDQLSDASSRFCRSGVQSETALFERLSADPELGAAAARAEAQRYADRVVVTTRLYESTASYYDTASCSFQECLSAFGEADLPTPNRDLRIVEAYQDRLGLAPPSVDRELFECCFPSLVSFEVRPREQWVVSGSQTGFLHATIADPVTGACRPSCDPSRAALNSRVFTTFGTEPPVEGSPTAFRSPFFRFAVVASDAELRLTRGMAFRFVTQGSFAALTLPLTTEDRPYVSPLSIHYLKPTDEIVVTDGALEGLLLLRGSLRGEARQYF